VTRQLTAATRVAAVIGDPISHSLSPVIHNAAFEAAGLDWAYVALPVPAGLGAAAVQGMRTLGIAGLSVTMPHKADVLDALDEVSDDASTLGAVNCISRRGDTLRGENTDGAGFLAGLRTDFGFDPAGRTCVVLGAGGAARAVVLALARAGAASVQVVNRTESSALAAAALAGTVGSVAPPEAVASADLVVNATPVGMRRDADAGRDLPCDVALLGPGQVVAELVYHPLRTPLVEQAAQRGARSSNGVSMLVHQAAVAFEHWTGQVAPVDAMRAAVDAHLGAQEGGRGGDRGA
jgi:shikimate dehydrogenase